MDKNVGKRKHLNQVGDFQSPRPLINVKFEDGPLSEPLGPGRAESIQRKDSAEFRIRDSAEFRDNLIFIYLANFRNLLLFCKLTLWCEEMNLIGRLFADWFTGLAQSSPIDLFGDIFLHYN